MLNLILSLAMTTLALVPLPLTTAMSPTSAQTAVQDPQPQTTTGITGTHEVLNKDGEPLVKDVKYTVEVTGATPFFKGKLYRDDGSGPVYQEGKDIAIFGGFGEYIWVNIADPKEGEERGGGLISETGPGEHDSDVTQGPHDGVERKWKKE